MAELVKMEPKEKILNLDEVLQCPVCYELPMGIIYQCNEGHHVCANCKIRLLSCPVCRSYFFGTRNFAMEALVMSIRKIRSFKLTGLTYATVPDLMENEEEKSSEAPQIRQVTLPKAFLVASSGLWKCFIDACQQKLPACRLVNHLRHWHRHSLNEARFENNEYNQVWDVPTHIHTLTNAISVQGLGVFWLNFKFVEGDPQKVYAWMTMAADNIESCKFSYTLRVTGDHREFFFSDFVNSSKLSEGSLFKNRRNMVYTDVDAVHSDTIRFQLRLWYDHERIDSSGLVSISSPHTTVRSATGPRQGTEGSESPEIDSDPIYSPYSSRHTAPLLNSSRITSDHFDVERVAAILDPWQHGGNETYEDYGPNARRTPTNRNRVPNSVRPHVDLDPSGRNRNTVTSTTNNRNHTTGQPSRVIIDVADDGVNSASSPSAHQFNVDQTVAAPTLPNPSRHRHKRSRRHL